jgi:hypothetical protein
MGPQLKNGLGVAAFVCGIVGLVLGLIPLVGLFFSIPLGILGIVFGAVGIWRVTKKEADNRGMAIAGLVTGILAIVIGIVITAAIGAGINQLNADIQRGQYDSTVYPARFQHDQKIVNNQEHILIDQGTFIGDL